MSGSGIKLTPFGASASGSVSVGAGGGGGTGVPFLSASTEQRLMNIEGRLRMLEQSLQGERQRADKAEGLLAEYRYTRERLAPIEDEMLDKANKKITYLQELTENLCNLLSEALEADDGYMLGSDLTSRIEIALQNKSSK